MSLAVMEMAAWMVGVVRVQAYTMVDSIDSSKHDPKHNPKGRGRPKLDGPYRSVGAIQVRSQPGWYDWVREFARFKGMSIATLTESALRVYAGHEGFREPPPR
jgi:hypothetical protein